MNKIIRGLTFLLLGCPLFTYGILNADVPFYPNDIKVVEGSKLLIANGGTRDLVLIGPDGNTILKWQFNEPVTGIAVDKNLAYVTSSEARGYMTIIDINNPVALSVTEVGMGARAPLLSTDRKALYIALQFEAAICKIDPETGKILGKTPVLREPFAMAVTPDGKYLFVNNFLPAQRADMDIVAADVSVIDLTSFTRIKDIKLSNGSNALRGICPSPDGKFMYITHNLGRFQVPTSQLEQGWMNTSGLSIIDVQALNLVATVVLDEPEYGAAGTWDINCNTEKIIITHSGTQDISVIDYHAFTKKLLAEPNKQTLSYNLNFLADIRHRYPVKGNGPRNFALSGNVAYIPTYFSDELNIFDISTGKILGVNLNPNRNESPADKGKRIFNDASHCFQGWQSCNGCHPGDARTDGLNWDLLNDGMGNPKNCKSMVFAHQTPPVMISGIRASAEVAVRAGFKHIQFNEVPEEDAALVDEYLKSLKPLPSPLLVNGKLSKTAKKGKVIFEREGCINCHSGNLYTDLKIHKIGDPDLIFAGWHGWDTPTLREVWRTAPYLFNGSAYDMKDVFEVHKHGLKHTLSESEIDQLSVFIKSL